MATMHELAQWIKSRNDIAIVPHVNPDGDALGSVLALKIVLDRLGKRSAICCQDPVPDMYAFLPGLEGIYQAQDLPFEPKALLFADAADFKRAGDRGQLSGKVTDWAVVDHHETNPGFAPVSVVDGNAPATGIMVVRLMDELGLEIDQEIAVPLYVAISTDTGNFSFPNTTNEVFEVMPRIMNTGMDLDYYSRLTFRMRSVPRAHLLGKALNGMKFYAGGKVAVTLIPQAMFDECGATAPDTEGIVNILSDIEGVQIAMTVESRDGGATTKFSLRSVGDIDVSVIARSLGGGGHKNAAGMNFTCAVEDAFEKAIGAVLAAVEG